MLGPDHEARDSSIIGLEGDPSIGFYFSSFFVEANVQAEVPTTEFGNWPELLI